MAEAATRNVLFLCIGSSARSILAAARLNHFGRGKFRAYGAGSFPKGVVHPLTLELPEEEKGMSADPACRATMRAATGRLRSKSIAVRSTADGDAASVISSRLRG
jgi:hypothetical protein